MVCTCNKSSDIGFAKERSPYKIKKSMNLKLFIDFTKKQKKDRYDFTLNSSGMQMHSLNH